MNTHEILKTFQIESNNKYQYNIWKSNQYPNIEIHEIMLYFHSYYEIYISNVYKGRINSYQAGNMEHIAKLILDNDYKLPKFICDYSKSM